MGIVLLIRHAVTDQTGKRLYGRLPGTHLSERGREQAEALAERLAGVPLRAVYLSPMERCRETAAPLARAHGLRPRRMASLNEVDYGRWAGRPVRTLVRSGAWAKSRSSPSRFRFPEGETLAEVQARTVRAVEELADRHPREVVAAVSHGDPVRLALTHFAGVHIDLFQRLEVAPASVSAVELGRGHPPRILRVNDTGTLEDLTSARG
jgi:probable phosphomutase (TIGR03848 family)